MTRGRSRRRGHGLSGSEASRQGRRPRARSRLPGICRRDVRGLGGGAGFGVATDAIWCSTLALHLPTRISVAPRTGEVFGREGQPIGAVYADGYVRFRRSKNIPKGVQYGHRAVWEAVYGPIPVGYQIDHKNGQKADNRISNLQLVTALQHARIGWARGQSAMGTRKKNALLTEEVVVAIRASSRSNGDWAAELGVHKDTVRDARRGRSWRHVRPCPRLRTRCRPRSER